jgi:F0F1-type ATP synthase assembly protein I
MPIKLDRDMLLKSSRMMAIGFELAGTVVGGLVLGYYLDRYAGTEPLFTILCTIAGMAGGMRVLLWALKRNSR